MTTRRLQTFARQNLAANRAPRRSGRVTGSLWQWAGRIYHEAIYQGAIAAAGSNTQRLVERLGKDSGYISKQARTVQIIGSFYLLFICFLPAITLHQLSTGGESSWNILVSTLAGSLQLIVQTGYLMMLTLVATSEILASELYRWPESLPITREQSGMLRVLALGREFVLPLSMIVVSTPIVAGITGGLPTAFVALVASISHAAITVSVTVLASWRLRRALRASSGSDRKAGTIRVLTMAGYALGIILIIAIMQFGTNFIISLFDAPRMAAGRSLLLLRLLAVVPTPAAPATLISSLVAARTGSGTSGLQVWMPFLGTGLYACLAAVLIERARRIIGREDAGLTTGESDARSPGMPRPLVVRSPRAAFRRQILGSATRDTQVLISLLFPVIIPLAILAGPSMTDAPVEILMYTMPVIASVLGGWLLIHGLSRTQAGTGLLEASLPLLERDRVYPRLAICAMIPTLGALLGAAVLLPSSLKADGILLSLIPLVAVPVGFLIKLRLFGRTTGSHPRTELGEISIDHRFWKWVLALAAVAGAGAALVAVRIVAQENAPTLAAAFIFVAVTGGAAAIVRVIAGRMFPSR